MSVNRTSSERGTDTIDPGRRLGEQRDEQVHAVALAQLVQPDPGTDAVAQAALDQGDGQAAVGQVVRGVDHAVAGGLDQDLAEHALGVQVHRWRQAAEVPVHDVRP